MHERSPKRNRKIHQLMKVFDWIDTKDKLGQRRTEKYKNLMREW